MVDTSPPSNADDIKLMPGKRWIVRREREEADTEGDGDTEMATAQTGESAAQELDEGGASGGKSATGVIRRKTQGGVVGNNSMMPCTDGKDKIGLQGGEDQSAVGEAVGVEIRSKGGSRWGEGGGASNAKSRNYGGVVGSVAMSPREKLGEMNATGAEEREGAAE